jgi:hypothetical protein
MPRNDHHLPYGQPRYPPPDVIDVEYYPAQYPLSAPGGYPPPYPAIPYGPPPAPRPGVLAQLVGVLRVACILLLALGAVWFLHANLNKQSAQVPATTASPAAAGPWWDGEWVAGDAQVPRLELQPRGSRVGGRLAVGFSAGYLMSLPLLNGEAGGDAVLFAVQGRPTNYYADFYLLQAEGYETAVLYKLAQPPPGRPYSANLWPQDLDKSHRLVARLVRSNPAAMPVGNGINR